MTQPDIDKIQRELTDWRFRAGLLAMCLLVALVLIVIVMVHYRGCSQ